MSLTNPLLLTASFLAGALVALAAVSGASSSSTSLLARLQPSLLMARTVHAGSSSSSSRLLAAPSAEAPLAQEAVAPNPEAPLAQEAVAPNPEAPPARTGAGSSLDATFAPQRGPTLLWRLVLASLAGFTVLGGVLSTLGRLLQGGRSFSRSRRFPLYNAAATAGTTAAVEATTVVPLGETGVEGVYFAPQSALGQRVLAAVPGLAKWAGWYEVPLWARNGHVHTIVASKARRTRAVSYHRTLLQCPTGGTVALDELVEFHPVRAEAGEEGAVTYVDEPSEEWQAENRGRPLLLMVSGLGGGSHDAYVRSMAVAAARRGWRAAVVNMRGCGGSPITTPRFFSAHRGSTDDVRLAVTHLRQRRLGPATPIAAMGWSNGATIVNNLLAEQETSHRDSVYRVDAAATLGCPLNMPLASQNFNRWFNRHIYDRAITTSLLDKLSPAVELFRQREIDTWDGGKCTIDVDQLMRATTIEGIDEHLTRRVFGFPTVDAYYQSASSDQRLKHIRAPTLIVNALDDPVAPGAGIPYAEVLRNENLVLAVTAHGGHLGWCEKDDPTDGSKWIEEVCLDFLATALDLPPLR
eukprot:EG_transcript_5153